MTALNLARYLVYDDIAQMIVDAETRRANPVAMKAFIKSQNPSVACEAEIELPSAAKLKKKTISQETKP